MASRYRPVSPRARSSFLSRLMVPVAIAGLLFVGLAIYTVVNGELRLPFGGGVLFAFQKEKTEEAPGIPKGMVQVIASTRNLPAYTKITRDHLWTMDHGMHTVPVMPAQIASAALYTADNDGLKNVLGRVLRRDKSVNFAFSESDFMPLGTRAGPSAGIPPGKRGMWVNLADVQGLADARTGDLVDLVAATKSEAAPRIDTNVLGNLADPVMKARLNTLANRPSQGSQANSWVVARGAKVIRPMRSRELNPGGNKRSKSETVEEVFLAFAPAEVSLFSQALARQVTMVAAPRSGQPESSPTEITDTVRKDVNDELRRMLTGEDDDEPTFGMVEVIRGGERQTVTVPRKKPGIVKR